MNNTNRKIKITAQEQFKELKRGCFELIPEDEFLSRLQKSFDEDRPLKIKFGADPSRPDIHLGHTVVLNKLRLLQDFGHEVYFLIGDFTARIGDPTGKSKQRPMLTTEEIINNAKTYQDQIAKVLDVSKLKIVFNNDWLSTLTSMEIVKLVSNVTVSALLHRDDFAKRHNAQEAIYLHEFLYPIFQGYDSVELKCDMELGGSDQTFNLMMGRELQKAFKQTPQVLLTMPILEGLDGVQKMSKSLDNYISINENATDMFGKVMSISDEMMIKYYELLSRLPHDEIMNRVKGIKEGSYHPMEAKKQLAVELTNLYYQNQGQAERQKFEDRFSQNKIPDDIQTLTFTAQKLDLLPILIELKFVESNGEARRLFKQNAIKINGKNLAELSYDLKANEEIILKVGKLRMCKILGK